MIWKLQDSLTKGAKNHLEVTTRNFWVSMKHPNLKQTLKRLTFPLKATAWSTDATRLAQVGLLTPNETHQLQIKSRLIRVICGSIPYTANSSLFCNKIAKLLKEQLLLTFSPSKLAMEQCLPILRRGHALPMFEKSDSEKIYVNCRKTKSSRVPQGR